MPATSLFHTTCGIAALASGAAVVGMRKGTSLHRAAGAVYVAAMTLLCTTSFFIYELFGGFGVFHAMSLVSLASLAGGMLAPVFRRRLGRGWLRAHYFFMLWSYVGLVMATGSHVIGVLRPLLYRQAGLGAAGSSWIAMGICWGLPCLAGGYLIQARSEALLARVRAARKGPRSPKSVSSE